MSEEIALQWLRRKGRLQKSGEIPSKIKFVHMQILKSGLWVHPAGHLCYRYRDAVKIIEDGIAKGQCPAEGYRLIPGVETLSARRIFAEQMPPDDIIDRIEFDVMRLAIEQPAERWTVGEFMSSLQGVSRPGIRKAIQNLLADGSLIKQGSAMHPWPVRETGRKVKRRSKLSARTKRFKRLAAKEQAK